MVASAGGRWICPQAELNKGSNFGLAMNELRFVSEAF